MTQLISSFYIAIDGDNVGRKIEYLIVTNQPEKLALFSKNYHKAMIWLKETLESNLNAEVVFSGGDSLLAFSQKIQMPPFNDLEILKSKFSEKSETTLSIGIGGTLRQAYFALKLAKAKGRNRIELFEGSSNE